MSSWDDTSFSSENRVRLNELIKIVDYRKITKFKTYRFIGELRKYAVVWLPIYKDGAPLIGQNGKAVNIPFNVTNYDPETESYDETKTCPFVEASEKIRKHIKDDKLANQFKPQVSHLALAINRDLQENPDKKGKPTKKERSSGFKESLDSDSFTPIECHQLNFSIGQQLESIKETNTVSIKTKSGGKKKVEKNVADEKYGRDVRIKYDANAKGIAKYKVLPGDRTPLNAENEGEDSYLIWDIVAALKETTLTTKEAKVEAERIVKEFMKSVKKKSSDEDDDDDEDLPEDIEETSSKKKKSKKKVEEDDDDEDEDLDLEDDDDEEEEEPKKSSKKKKKVVEDDDEEESPAPKKSKKKPVKSKSKKKKVEEDDDEDEDEDDDIEIDLDDDDEDEEDDDE